jgi:uncharacterized protein YbjT (DUF2867 family)
MDRGKKAVVTGAFSYLGKYITRELLKKGVRVKTLTGHPDRGNEFGGRVETAPFHFAEPARMAAELEVADWLFNTYWVRFNRGRVTYGGAVANTQNLITAAREAKVKRFVHVSITNPSPDSPLGYFSGKAAMEKTLIESGLSYAIIRPTVLFGKEDILINNIAWLMRRSPVFGVFGRGDYRVQPVYVGDVAALAVKLVERDDNVIVDAVGPETYAYADLVRLVREWIKARSAVVRVPPLLAWLAGLMARPLVGDVLITREEIRGLMEGLLVSERPPSCPTRFSEWIKEHAAGLGRGYASELSRHYR